MDGLPVCEISSDEDERQPLYSTYNKRYCQNNFDISGTSANSFYSSKSLNNTLNDFFTVHNGSNCDIINNCEPLLPPPPLPPPPTESEISQNGFDGLLPPPPPPPLLDQSPSVFFPALNPSLQNGFHFNNSSANANITDAQKQYSFSSNAIKSPENVETTTNNDLQITLEDFKNFEEELSISEENGGAIEDPDRFKIRASKYFTQSIIPSRFYVRDRNVGFIGTDSLKQLQSRFEQNVVEKIALIRKTQPRSDPPPISAFYHSCCDHHSSSISHNHEDGSDSENEDNNKKIEMDRKKEILGNNKSNKKDPKNSPTPVTLLSQEVERKMNHPAALHSDIAFNEPGQLNDGPNCKCSWNAKQVGIRHDKFAGETPVPICDPNSNNINNLYHYFLSVEPEPGSFSRKTTSITTNGQQYIFEGFSLFFHRPLPETFPQTPINPWSNDFSIRILKEIPPESFTVRDLELFHTFLFEHILELYDLRRELNATEPSCLFYHCMPRFVRKLAENDEKEVLPMSAVLTHFTETFVPFMSDKMAMEFFQNEEAFRDFAHARKGEIFINPKMKPMSIRADLIDSFEQQIKAGGNFHPLITHFGVRASAYAYNGKPQYQKALRNFVKLRHLVSLKKKPTGKDYQMLEEAERKFNALKAQCTVKRDVDVTVSSKDYFQTGLCPDIVHHAMLMVLAVNHIRFHCSLKIFEEERIQYIFKNPELLQLALIHPSFRTNYGTNHDHAKNTLNNIGLRIGRDGKSKDAKVQQQQRSASRKRGINALMKVMAMHGSQKFEQSEVMHNERLEFLGDAVVEFITTIHLFFMFQELEEGGLATYRSALVQNNHLATLAERIGLQEFMIYAHGPDLCHEHDLHHAMANAFEALMAAIFLDGSIKDCDRIFSKILYGNDSNLFETWNKFPAHPLKRDLSGDRELVEKVPCLKLLSQFEDSIGVKFNHIRLLAKAFTRRNIPYNYLTLGHNQRLELLGDTVLQLITTEYLYKHFPHHHEGHLSLLRTCLVSNKTQSVVCDDLAMTKYLVIPKSFEAMNKSSPQLRIKDKADLVEAFIGALYVDKGLQYCTAFCKVCFFPRLKYFISNQRWNDPKSQLQQCCLTLRQPESEPDIPEYKTIGIEGSTNTRTYRVAVYFRGKRLAAGNGGSIHQAQMDAAVNALSECAHLFPKFVVLKNGENADDNNLMMGINGTAGEPPFKRRRPNNHRNGRRRLRQSLISRKLT